MKLSPQVFVSHTTPAAAELKPVENEMFWKPRKGGLWTSTLHEEGGDWVRWLLSTGYGLEDKNWGGKLWLLEPADANIAVVANPDDLNELAGLYPLPKPSALSESRVFDRLLDWEAIAKDYDAVHIPNPWPWRFGIEDHSASMFFYSMDAECTCWFRWCFEGEPQVIDAAPYIVCNT